MGCAAGPQLPPSVGSGVSGPRGGLPQPLQGVRRLSGRPRPPASTGSSSPPGWAGPRERSPLGARRRARARTSKGPSPRARGEPTARSAGPRRTDTLLGALLPRTGVPLGSVAMSSVFGKPRAGSGPQSAPLEVNLAILGRRGAGKSGELGGGAEGKGLGWDPRDRERVWTLWTCLQAGSPTDFGGFLHPGGLGQTA